MSRSKKSIKNLIFAIIGQGLGLLISFVARIIFIRVLGSDYLGLNGLFTNILTVLSLAELGVGEAITYSLYKPLAQKDTYKCQMLMELYKKIYIVIGIFVFVVGVAITPLLPIFIKDMPDISNINLIYILFVINTSISYFFSYKRNLIIADQNRYIATLYRYSFYFLLNVVQIVYLLIAKEYIGFLILQIISTFLENVLISVKADRMYPFLKNDRHIKLDSETKKEITKNTRAMMMHKIGTVIVNSTDNILLSSFVGLNAVGIYSNYYLVINALHTVLGQIFSSITASVGNLCASEGKEKQYDIFEKIYFIDFWIYSFSAICIFCLLNSFIKWWIGSEYLFTMDIVIVLVINYYITGMRKSVLTFREAAGLFYKDRWKPVFESIVNLVVSILLALKCGTLGVFLGTFISSVSVCVWVEPYILYKYGFKRKLREYFSEYFKYLFITIILAIICYALCSLIKLSGILEIMTKLMVCIIIPNLVLFLIYKRDEKFVYLIDLIKKLKPVKNKN